MEQYDSLIAPAAAMIVGIVAALATMMVNRERYSQKIERLSIAVKNVEGFPKMQEGLVKEIARLRLRMGYGFNYPVVVFMAQLSTFYLLVGLPLLPYAIYKQNNVLISGSVISVLFYLAITLLDQYFYKDYVKNHA